MTFEDDGREYRKIYSEIEKKFNIMINVGYYTDAKDKAPIPVLKKYRVTINKDGVNIER